MKGLGDSSASHFIQDMLLTESIHDDLKPKVEGEIDSLRSQVETILTPDQLTRWNTSFEKMKERWLPPAPGAEPKAPPGYEGPRDPRQRHDPLSVDETLRAHPTPEHAFENADTDRDGSLTVEEFSEGLPHETEERFEKLDTDNDGSLSLDEFRAGGPPPRSKSPPLRR